MDLQLQSKSAFITGGSRGIGRAIAQRLVEEGAKVAICARGSEQLAQEVAELQEIGDAWGDACDVSDAGAYKRWLEDACAAIGDPDLLVVNASALAVGGEESDWEASFQVDLMGAVRATTFMVPKMAERGGGSIVFVSSVAAVERFVGPTAYNALKAAMITYGSQLAKEVGSQNIRVNCVSPGAIEFPGGVWDRARIESPDFYQATVSKQPMGRLGTAEEVADVVAFLLSDRASWITGENVVIDGGKSQRVAF